MRSSTIAIVCLALLGTLDTLGTSDVPRLLRELQLELGYETLLLLYNSSEHCPARLQLETLPTPRLLLRAEGSFYLRAQLSSRLLALLCLSHDPNMDEPLLQALATNLEHMRQTPILLLLREGATEERLRQLFEDCRRHKMLNVLAFNSEQQQLYSYRAYPQLELLQRSLSPYYEKQPLRQLGGHELRTMPDRIMPRSVTYRDHKSGKLRLGGYVARLVKTFAESLNATLAVNWNEKMMFQHDMANLTYEDGLDIPMCLYGLAFNMKHHEHTYPVEYTKWQLYLPVEPEVPTYLLFFLVFKWPAGLLIGGVLLLSTTLLAAEQLMILGSAHPLDSIDRVLRAYLAQSFAMPRRLRPSLALLCWLMAQYGVLLSNIYLAYLQMLFFHAPTQPPIRSYEQLRASSRQILFFRGEVSTLISSKGRDFWLANADLFRLTDSVMQLQHMRSSLNTSYVYAVTSSLLPLLQERQSKLRRPLFRIDGKEELILREFVPFALPLARNSIYKQPFDSYLSWVQATGLLQYWMRSAYFEMVQLGELPFYQAEETFIYREMIWQDFLCIWLGFAMLCGLSCIAFLAEFLIYRYAN